MKEMRLQKYLAQCGVASRRKCEEMIAQGRVTVNGTVVREMGTTVDPQEDLVSFDGKTVSLQEKKVYYMLNKPRGVICAASDPFGRKTVLDCIEQAGQRIYPVGRLDYETEGLILLTNDGDFAQRILHPSFEIEKVYYAVVDGSVTEASLQHLRRGIPLEDGMTAPAKARVLRRDPDTTALSIIIHEGRNRQVRRMMDALGHPVRYLRRERVGPLELGKLPIGAWRTLTTEEIVSLLSKTP